MGCRSAEVESIAAADKQPDLCILTDINTPFEQDGTRDGENIRGWMDSVFREELEKSGRKFIEVKGNPGQRLETSLTAIRELAAQKGANNLGPSENHPCGT
jgi:nicotinamide riboside kinase